MAKKIIGGIIAVITIGLAAFGIHKILPTGDEDTASRSDGRTVYHAPKGHIYTGETPPTSKVVIPAGWKTYKNKEYGYEISYPSDWKKNEGEADAAISFSPISGTNIKEGDMKFGLDVYDDIPTPGNRYQLAEKQWLASQSCPHITIAGLETSRCVVEGPFNECNGENNIQFFFKRGSRYYEGVTIYSCNGKDNKIGDQILSTLSFIK